MYLLRLDPHFPWQPAAVTAATRAVYDGFRVAATARPDTAQLGIIVNERSAAPILPDATAQGFTTACTIGTIGDATFDNENGNDLAVHSAASDASYWRVVFRFNPDGGCALDSGRVARLRRLSEALHCNPRPRLICDLIVPPTQRQLAAGIRVYDRDLLPELTSHAIEWLHKSGVVPDVWEIQGFDQKDDYRRVLSAATRGRSQVSFLVRAAGHSDVTTYEFMSVGLSVAGVSGVVLGPAPFWQPVIAWMNGQTTRSRAVAAVASQFSTWVTRLEAGRPCSVQEEGC